MFSTQILPELLSVDDAGEENMSEIVGFIIVGDKKFEVKKGETKIGRDSSMCSIVIENFTVSKVHAVIESEGIDDTFIYDVGSTNQTKLKKKVLKPQCRYKLDNESKLIFGNVTAEFILFPHKNSDSNIKPNKSDSVTLNLVEELGDIFDVATQVTAPQSTIPSETLVFEKRKGNFPILKIPNLMLSAKIEKSGESLRDCFDEMTQCRLNFEEETSQTVSNNCSFEKSDIFNLKTQCQIYETSMTEQNVCEAKIIPCDNNSKIHDTDKIKFLLNDGQGDVLCTFMSLHSPKEKKNDDSLMEVKIKNEDINLSQELDAPTQVQSEIIQESSGNYETKMKDFIKNEDLSRDFSSKISYQPNITASTPLNKKFKLGHSNYVFENNDRPTEHIEEDFIMTQEFKADGLNSIEKYTSVSRDLVSVFQNKTHSYLRKTLNDFSVEEQENINEDLILTQALEVVGKTYRSIESERIIPESDDLSMMDFKSNQMVDFGKEKQRIKEKSTKIESALLPGTVNKDAESHLDETLDFTQRVNQNYFISNQTFDEMTDLGKENNNFKKKNNYDDDDDDDDDDDFISTQPFPLPVIKTRNSRSPHEGTVNVKTSKESSPDLLGLEDTWKNNEDCIATQRFEILESGNLKSNLTKFTLLTDPKYSSFFETEKCNCYIEPIKVPRIIDSSGDETESDLEILFDSNGKGKDRKFSVCVLESLKADSESESCKQRKKSATPESSSNSSYIFELKPENCLEDNAVNKDQSKRLEAEASDTDATDCEELAIMCLKIPKKLDLSNKIEIEENQLTSTVPQDFAERTSCSNDDWTNDKGIAKFEIEKKNSPLSPLSLEMPNTQEIETTINSLQRNASEKKENFQSPLKISRTELGINNLNENITVNEIDLSKRQSDSLLKRFLDSDIADTVPLKKPKSEVLNKFFKSTDRQFSRLVKAHDVSQIQPNRTRNSVKMLTTGNNFNKSDISLESNITNERPISRRKGSGKKSIKQVNGDITSYLTTKKMESRRSSCAGRKKEISLRENKVELKPDEGNIRILRSSESNKKISTSLLMDSPTRVRRSKRNSRTKSVKYFNNPYVNIVFTGFECESLDKIVCDLGGKKTNDLSFGEVVVADKVRRTVKFLCAIGLSLPITSPQWLMTCKKKKKFLNPWDFILKDEESEKKWDFELKTSLEKSRKMKLLQGFNVFATKNTKPAMKDMLAIVECCGGTPLSSPPDVWPKNTIIVTCLEDKKWWPVAKFRNVKVVHYEFILSGVLKQKIDFKTYRLQ